jgi:inositol-phosphate transport system permease protein
MSSTSQPVTTKQPAPPRRFYISHIIAVVGAVVAIIGFFLPWLGFYGGSGLVGVLSGLHISAGPVVALGAGVEVFRGSATSYLAPLAGVVALGMVLVAFRRGVLTQWDGFGLITVGLIPLLYLWGQYGTAQRDAGKVGIDIQYLYGMYLIFLALLAVAAAGVMNIRSLAKENDSFRNTLGAYGFMAPGSVLVTIFFFIPVILLLLLSLTDLASSNFGDPWTYIGFENYRRMFSDTFFPKILGNTIFYVVTTLFFFNVGLGLVLALLTAHINRRASFFFRLIWLLPRITPSVVYIVMWQRFTQVPPYGIINQFVGLMGIEHQPYWLNEAPWLFVIMANGFVGASFGMIIFTSAIESIPKDFIIAAKVDGASTWQIIRDITLPLLRWPLLFVTTYQTLSLLVSFEYILLLTEGGPGLFTTEVWALTAYKRALFTYFGSNQWAYGAAWGFVLVVIGAALSIIYLRVFQFNELVQEPKIDVL